MSQPCRTVFGRRSTISFTTWAGNSRKRSHHWALGSIKLCTLPASQRVGCRYTPWSPSDPTSDTRRQKQRQNVKQAFSALLDSAQAYLVRYPLLQDAQWHIIDSVTSGGRQRFTYFIGRTGYLFSLRYSSVRDVMYMYVHICERVK